MLQQLKRWARYCARDEGVAGLVIAMIIAIVSFSALSIFLARNAGPARELALSKSANEALVRTEAAVYAYFQLQSPMSLPCPDTNLDGAADACSGAGTASGTLPWSTMGLSRDDAIDSYGRYYSYVVTADAAERQQCVNVDDAYSTAVDYTGDTVFTTSLELRTVGQAAGQGRYVPFAIISHGPNGLGARTSSGGTISTASAAAGELANASANTAVVYSGPYNTASASAFDDQVIAPTVDAIADICAALSEGGQANASLTEDFSGTGPGFDSTKFTTNGSGTVPTQTGGVAQFTDATSYLATASSLDFSPASRAVYISAYWTPDAANTSAGFSLATRADLADLTSGTDEFNGQGITFRFYSTGSAGANSISIREDTTQRATSSGTFNLVMGQQYFLEAYDNGEDVWMRISQVSTPTNSAVAFDNNTTSDTNGGQQKVVFINGGTGQTNRIDRVLIGYPMLSLETGPADGFAEAGVTNGTSSGDLTLEAWIMPRAFPASEAAIVTQWDTGDIADSSFRLFMNSSGALYLDLNDDSATAIAPISLGITATLNTWMHVAVTYNRSNDAVLAYRNGTQVGTATAALDASGVHEADVDFAIGADSIAGANGSNIFHGNFAEIRVYDDVRTGAEISRCYNRRLGDSTLCDDDDTDLMAYWRLNPTPIDNGFQENRAEAVVGTFGQLRGGPSWAPALSVFFRPNANEVCAANRRVSAYRCDFRTAQSTSVTMPEALEAIYIKAWGAGGGSSENVNTGGGGAYAAGLIDNGATNLLTIDVGAGGIGETAADTPGAAGGNTVVSRSTDDLTAGGGGGAPDNAAGAGGTATVEAAFARRIELSGDTPEPGCIPSGDPCIDAHYLSLSSNGRGGEPPGAVNGRPGAVILIW